jgi:NDP-sugar pyrophosphorylase family protein
MSDVTHAMILAAGLGQRLRPLTERIPKALVRVGGRPLIDYALDTLLRAGITDVVVNLHHLGDEIRKHLGDGSTYGIRTHYSEENPLLDSGGGIAWAEPLLGHRTFITMNTDTIIDVDLRSVVRFHSEHGAVATLVVRKDPSMERFGLIHVSREGRIGRFLSWSAPQTVLARTGSLEPFMYTGVQVLEPRVFGYMARGSVFSMTRETYPRMLEKGEPIYAYSFIGTWLTVGTPDELAAAERALRNLPARLSGTR